jgi:hypothetical protein
MFRSQRSSTPLITHPFSLSFCVNTPYYRIFLFIIKRKARDIIVDNVLPGISWVKVKKNQLRVPMPFRTLFARVRVHVPEKTKDKAVGPLLDPD